MSNQNKNTVTKLQASDGTNLGTFSVGSMPSGLIYDGNNAGRNSVTRIPAIRNESSAIRNDLVLGSSWQLVLGSRLVRIHCSASSQLTGKREVIPKVRFADDWGITNDKVVEASSPYACHLSRCAHWRLRRGI